jgi:hypothetical protein
MWQFEFDRCELENQALGNWTRGSFTRHGRDLVGIGCFAAEHAEYLVEFADPDLTRILFCNFPVLAGSVSTCHRESMVWRRGAKGSLGGASAAGCECSGDWLVGLDGPRAQIGL